MSVGTQSAPIVVKVYHRRWGRHLFVSFRLYIQNLGRYTGTGIPVQSMNFAIARIIRVAQILVSKELHDVVLTNVDHLRVTCLNLSREAPCRRCFGRAAPSVTPLSM